MWLKSSICLIRYSLNVKHDLMFECVCLDMWMSMILVCRCSMFVFNNLYDGDTSFFVNNQIGNGGYISCGLIGLIGRKQPRTSDDF